MIEVTKSAVIGNTRIRNTGPEMISVRLGTKKTGYQSRVLFPGDSIEFHKGTRYVIESEWPPATPGRYRL